jgi:hypothetical protein
VGKSGKQGAALKSLDDRGEDTWKNHEYLVKWVDEAKEWAKSYEIQEYIIADQEGRDPSGRINEDEELAQVNPSLVWTWWGEPNHVTSTELGEGPFAGHIFGWFIGTKPKPSHYTSINFLKEICGNCEGKHTILATDDDGWETEVDCKTCEGGSSPSFVFLDNTDFWNPDWTKG